MIEYIFNKMQFQIISDIHIESGVNIQDVVKPVKNTTLIVAGDLGRVENYDAYYETLKWLCDNFNNVILVPGNHEYYTSNSELNYFAVNSTLFKMKQTLSNLIILIDDYVTINDILIFGSTFWSYCPKEYFINIPLHYEPHKLIDAHAYNKLHLNAQKKLEMCIEYAYTENLKVLVVTHHAPTFAGTLHPKYRDVSLTKNYMYCSNSDHFLGNNVVKCWIYGHTGYNGVYDKLVSNQVGKNNYNQELTIKL